MKLPSWLLPVMLLLALGAGLLTLLQQRMEEGSSYQPYSTFRADPFGTKGLYLALNELPGRPLQVERRFQPLSRLAKGLDGKEPDLTGTTVLLLGDSPQQWATYAPSARMKAIENIARQGGRVVLAFAPTKSTPIEYQFEDEKKKGDEKQGEKKPSDQKADGQKPKEGGKDEPKPAAREEAAPAGSPTPATKPLPDPAIEPNSRRGDEERPPTAEERRGLGSLLRRLTDTMGDAWGVSIVREKRPPAAVRQLAGDSDIQLEETYAPIYALPDPAAGLGRETLPWLSVLDFRTRPSETPLWRTIYTRSGRPAIIEREFGRGTLVLCSDTFFLSNEALFREHYPAALNWLLGRDARRVVFDEHYLGTRQDPGLMSLANRFGLTGAVLGFVVLALLYVWRNASPLVPPPPDPGYEGAPPQAGLGAEAGFPSLLRRAVAENALARFAFEQWRQQATGQDLRVAPNPARVAELESVLTAADPKQKKNPAALYRAMREKLGVRARARPH